jgi:hypothetical protein
MAIDGIAVFRQPDAHSQFRIVRRFELTNSP